MKRPAEYLDPDVYARPTLALDPGGAIAIKRDVHNFEVDADATTFADAFHRTMCAPKAQFGLVRVIRTRAETGEPFALNKRFQGQYQLDEAILDGLDKRFRRWLARHARPFLRALHIGKLVRLTEDLIASDYGVVTAFDIASPTRPTMTYTYLEGSPIAGSSTFEVTPLGPGRCLFTQIFVYQELHLDFVLFFSTQGLKLHDQVVFHQVAQTAKALGVGFRNLDMPPAYVVP